MFDFRFRFSNFHNLTIFRVIVGDTNKTTHEGSELEIPINQIHAHNNYVPGKHANDIALVKLSNSVNISSPNVNTLCLPVFGERPFTATDTCFVTGWGQTKGREFRPAHEILAFITYL